MKQQVQGKVVYSLDTRTGRRLSHLHTLFVAASHWVA